MSITVYKLLHLIGITLILSSLSGVLVYVANGGKKEENKLRALLSAGHGLGLLLIIISGFGMLARLGILGEMPSWVWIKLIIWLLLGGMLPLAYRKAVKAPAMLKGTVLLVILGAILGLFHG